MVESNQSTLSEYIHFCQGQRKGALNMVFNIRVNIELFVNSDTKSHTLGTFPLSSDTTKQECTCLREPIPIQLSLQLFHYILYLAFFLPFRRTMRSLLIWSDFGCSSLTAILVQQLHTCYICIYSYSVLRYQLSTRSICSYTQSCT